MPTIGPLTKGGEEEPKAEEKGCFMGMVQDTYFGARLAAINIKIDGWAAFSYNVSTTNVTNLPVTWTDRADTALLQQMWLNVGMAPDLEINEVQSGFMVAFLYGSDYRFTTIRGLFNNQLKNPVLDPREANGFEQNIYGGDIPLFYYSLFLPGFFQVTQIDIGQVFTPRGYESVLAPSTPLMSRSYAFKWAPTFFHVGAMATTKMTDSVTVKNAIVNGNDVCFDGSQAWRYVGAATLTSEHRSRLQHRSIKAVFPMPKASEPGSKAGIIRPRSACNAGRATMSSFGPKCVTIGTTIRGRLPESTTFLSSVQT